MCRFVCHGPSNGIPPRGIPGRFTVGSDCVCAQVRRCRGSARTDIITSSVQVIGSVLRPKSRHTEPGNAVTEATPGTLVTTTMREGVAVYRVFEALDELGA